MLNKRPPKTEIKERLYAILLDLESQLQAQKVPELHIKTRSKTNIFLKEKGYWELGDEKKTRKTLKTKGGAKELLKLVHMISYIIEQMEAGKTSTIRECYYCALNWIDEARFEKVNDSNTCLENIQIILNCVREDFGMYPNEEGKISGPIELEYQTRGKSRKKVNCVNDVGTSGFLLPRSLSEINVLSTTAKFVLVVETAGLHSRLMEERFDELHHCIILCSGGMPSRVSRMFLKMLNTDYGLPIAIFTDGDAAGVRIASSIMNGAVKSSHLSKFLCVPSAIHIGLYPSQIEEHNLPTDSITKLEKENLGLMLNDPGGKFDLWRDHMNEMLRTGRKAEQQAFCYHGIEYVSKVFLPNVLRSNNFPI